LRFPGQQYDAATGLHYNYFRDYEPGTGRYVQSDPIGLLGGMTTYSYGDSNPLLLSDSLGLASEDQRADCCSKTPRPENIRKKGFGGFVACCGGQQVACTVVPDDYSAEGKKVIGDCFEAHEIEHTKDPLVSCNCSNPLPHAAGTEYGMGMQAECSAYRVSLGCLEKKNICRKRNDQCRREVKKMIMDYLEFGRACAW
jgi:RHS repeat-associated protein